MSEYNTELAKLLGNLTETVDLINTSDGDRTLLKNRLLMLQAELARVLTFCTNKIYQLSYAVDELESDLNIAKCSVEIAENKIRELSEK